MRKMQSGIEDKLEQIKIVKRKYENDLLKKKHVWGCGIGFKEISGKLTSDLSVLVFVESKQALNRLKAEEKIPSSLEGIPTDVQAMSPDIHWRRAGHVSLTFTPRCSFFCKLLSPLCKYRCLVEAKLRIIETVDQNKIDAALGSPVSSDVVVPEILGLGIPKDIEEAQLGMKVFKSGRTTGVTRGTVKALDVSLIVDYPGRGLALFKDQIASSYMSEPGDSGALVVDSDLRGVGLLFAGARKFSFMNRIQNVFSTLNIDGFLTKGDPALILKTRQEYENGKKRTEDGDPFQEVSA